MKLKNWLGPSYTLKSKNYDSQRVINWYTEYDELGDAKENEPCMLAPTPGYTLQHTFPRSPLRALWHTSNKFIYCVAGNGLFLLTPTVSNGVISWAHTLLTYLTTSSGYVSICDGIPNQYQGIANTGLINQVVVVDGSTTGYVFQEGTTEVYQMNAGTGYAGSNFVTFQDGIFIFSQPDTISGYYASDPQNISDLDTLEANLNNDNIARIISDHDILWMIGNRALSVWQNTGGSTTTNVFQQIPGATAPTGTTCPWAIAQVAGQLLWVTNDNNGYGEVVQAFGYRPMRVSNYAVEIWLQNLGDISQTIAWVYQEEGHTWYCLNNPNSDTTWCFDITHKEWHERALFTNGQYSRDLANSHTNAFVSGYGNIRLVGDYQNGNIYSIDASNFTHNGIPIRRERTTPHQSGAYKRLFYPQLQIDVEAGTGLDGLGLPVQIGVGTPTLQTATAVLVSGNGPYTLVGNDGLPATPTGSVTITSNGPSSNWSQSYTVSGNTVTVNPAALSSGIVAIGSGNGTETNYQIPNIYPASATAQVWINDWRGNNLQIQAPAKNQNLCLDSYTFSSGWTAQNCFPNGGEWNTPDYAQSPAGTFLTEDSTLNPHGISIPYAVVAGQTTNLSIYATTSSAVAGSPGTNTPEIITTTSLTGGVASFGSATSGSAPTMTLGTVFTNGILALGDIVNCPALSTPNQAVVALLSGTLGAAGSTYACFPGWTTAQSSQAVTASSSTQRFLELALGEGSTTVARGIFNLQTGTVVASANCTPVITPSTTYPGVYRFSIDYVETATAQTILTGNCPCTGSGNQLTLSAPPATGSVTTGSTIYSLGVSTGITVLSLASGALGAPGSVYNLSGPCPFTASSAVQFGMTGSATIPSAYINVLTSDYAAYGVTSGPQNYPGNGVGYVGVWGCQIGPQAAVLPLVQTVGVAAYDNVTYTADQGLFVFEQPPFAAVDSISAVVVQPAAAITATFTATVPQLLPTEYLATFQYMEGSPIYEYIGTDPQICLSYSSDGGKTFSAERAIPIGKDGQRYQRCIWRKIKGGVRDMVFKVTCSDPVLINLLGAEINVKQAENAQ